MKIKRLGVEWGAAFEEASPHRVITESGEAFEFFETGNGDIKIILPRSASIGVEDRKNGTVLTVTIENL